VIYSKIGKSIFKQKTAYWTKWPRLELGGPAPISAWACCVLAR
jgi:hypothetical protein